MPPTQPHQPSGPGLQPPVHPHEYAVDPTVPLPRPHFSAGPVPKEVLQHEKGQYEVVPPVNNTAGASGHNPYEFIIAPSTAKKKPVSIAHLSFMKQLAVVIGGLVVLLIVAAVVISSLAPKSSVPGLTAVAQRQQEIIRIATSAQQQNTSVNTSNFVTNAELTMISSQTQVLTYLQAHNAKLNSKILALDADPKTDSLLTNAAAANNYDSTVISTLDTQLTTYLNLLKTTYRQTGSATAKQLLQKQFSAAHDLLDQAQVLQSGS